MNAIEILSRLESVNFTTDQARAITEIIDGHHHQLATRDDVKTIRDDFKHMATKNELKASTDSLKIIIDSTVTKAKYDLARWIVGAIIANGIIATLLKFFA